MRKVIDGLYVGTANEYENIKNDDSFYFVQACKYPYHRNTVGYLGKSCPINHPEYLYAIRDNRIVLNLIDANTIEYIPKEIIDIALQKIHENIKNGKKVFCHCNLGISRSPSICILYLRSIGFFEGKNAIESILYFKNNILENYSPNKGILDFVIKYWNDYENINKGGNQ